MATKEQERKALAQIKKILAGLGEESYIAHAMDGMIEDAEQNIENDFWNSYRNRYEYMNVQCAKAEDDLADALEKAKEAEKKQQIAEGLLQTKIEEATHWFNLYNTVKTNADTAKLESLNGAAELQRKVEAQELEIIKLKAKLYDLMVAEK